MNASNLAAFLETYAAKLRQAREEHPEEYGFAIEELDAVTGRMQAAIVRGTFNKDGRAFRATCRALGLKHTYAAIDAFIGRES